MAFDDSLIGSNDFDPKSATEDLIRRTSDEPLPDVLDPRMLNTRLARKLGREPKAVAAPTPPKTDDKLDFSSQAVPAPNAEPSEAGDPNGLDFTSQVQQPAPAPTPGMNIGGPTALGKGLVTGAVEGVGGVMKGAARLGNEAAPYLESLQYDPYGNVIGQTPVQPQKPIDQNPLYHAGKVVEGAHPDMSPEERDSLTGRVGTMVGGIAPYAAAAAVGGPAIGIAAGFTGMGADTYGKVFEDAKAKGADDATATTAASKAATAAGILGALPLGTGKLASSIVGKIVSQGLTFAGTNEATEYVLQEIAKDYDPKAGYTPEAKRIIASLITGGMMGGLHSFEGKKPEQPAAGNDTTSPPDANGPSGPGVNGPGPDAANPGQSRPNPDNGPQPGGGRNDSGGRTSAGNGRYTQGEDGIWTDNVTGKKYASYYDGWDNPGAKAKTGEQQKPGEPPKGEGEEVPDDHTVDPKMRAKMERVYRTFDPKGDPSKMTDAELFRAVNEHLRDTSDTGYTAKEDTPEEKAQREQHQTKQTEDADLKQAFPWMTDAQIQSMTPDMRAVWVNRARGAKPGSEDGNAPKSASPNSTNPAEDANLRNFAGSAEKPAEAASSQGENLKQAPNTGRREAPIVPKTADDVVAAQPVEPKSAAQAQAENYQHAHMELPHLGLAGQHSLSIETGVGQTRKGPPGPDGEPEWEVKLEHGAYGRIKGTRGADGQPLDIMVGPHPSSPHVFIINQHDPKTGKFDELKVQAGYRTPIDAMHAYVNSYDDGATGRIGGMVAMTAEQFHAWLRHGNHAAAVAHGDAKAVLARAFPKAGEAVTEGGVVEKVASSPGLHNAGEEAHLPLTEASTEAAVVDVPKGSLPRDANEAIGRPAAITNPKRESFKADEKLSLLEFLADRGGLAPHAELRKLGLGNSHRVQIPGRKGFFGLVKDNGWDLDTAREAAEELGYLQGDNENVTSTPRHLLDAIDTELRGNKLYPYQGEGQRTKVKERLDAERESYEQSRAQEIEDELNAAGYGEVAGELRQRALRHVTVGVDPDTAIQTAMAEMDAEHVLETPAEFDAIYGDGAYDEVLAGIPYEGGPTSSGQSSEDHWSYEDALDRTGARTSAGSAEVRDRRSEEAADDQGTRRTETTAEGGPVREPARAKQRAAGRSEAAGDEAGNAARHQPTAEAADDTEGGIKKYASDEGPSFPEFKPSKPLLILACSETKAPLAQHETTRFINLYTGPMWQQVKAIGYPTDSVAAISALYGWLSPGTKIEHYDRKMDEKTADRQSSTGSGVEELANAIRAAGGAYVVGGALYRQMVETAIRRHPDLKPLVTFADGTFLQMRKQLGEWLRTNVEAADDTAVEHRGKVAAAIDDERGNPIVETGAVFKTASGRETSPAPKIDASTDRRTKKAIFSLNSWLLDEARKEVAGNDYQSTLLKGIDPKNMTQSDQDTVNSLLFGDPDGPRPSDLVRVDGKKPAAKAKSVDDLTEAEKKAHRDAPTWAQVLAELPMHKDGRTHEFEIAFDIIKEITGKKKAPKFDDLTPEQKGELYERVKAMKPAESNVGPLDDMVGEYEVKPDGSLKRVTTETGADNKPQTVIPGAEKAADKTMAQRGADAPLKPKANQKPADDGLFGDGHKQTDIFDMPAKKPEPKPAPVKDELDDALDQAINEHRAKPLSIDEVAKGLTAIFGKKPTGLAEPETLFFDEATYAQALPYFKAGMSQVANAGDLLSMARALVSQLAGAGMDVETITAMKPYMRRFMDDVRSGKETINAPSRGEVLERDRSNAAAQDRVGAADVPAAAGGAEQGAGSRGGEADAGDQRPATGERLPQDYAPVVGERGDLEIPEREPVVDDRDAAAPESERSADGGSEGFQFDQRADGEAEEAAQRTANLNARRAAQAAADAKKIPWKEVSPANIAASLPMLFPEQLADVLAAEQRFAKANGHGMLFTNGTGTGKTYSGLGVIKRFFQKGTPNTLVVAPSQGILLDWQKAARDMGLEAYILDSTVDKGRGGLNLTTYANLGNNPTLADREWDLVTADEAHNLSAGQDGSATDALRTLRALTLHPDGLDTRAQMVLRDLYSKIKPLTEKSTEADKQENFRANQSYRAKAKPLIESWQDRARPKAVFLSATPFAYHFSLDWAEGYLFEHDRSKDSNGGYNAPTGRDAFYMQHLGYRKRVGKLTKPDAEVKQEVMERQLHEYLKKTGSLAGRMLTVDKDYDRKFILAHDAIGNQIDQALNFLQDNEEFRPLHEYVAKRFDYLTRMRLLEAIKARAAIDYINQSLALGRKVVVFHDYNEGGGINPFDLTFADDAKASRYRDGKHEDVELKPLYEDFIRQNPYVKELKFSSYGPPLQTLTGAFPKALTYNGTVSKKKRDAAKTLFNDDNSGHDLIIVQSAAGEAGISLHDTTGKHQRVTLNLGMPIRPVSAIQQEGRIYRVGQASDALFRYMNTGTDWERWTFAGKIADRAGTAENLALGNQARTIRQAFIDAFANAEDYRPETGEGTGGKEADRAVTHSMSEFQKAKTHYYAQQKVTGRRDQREGTDYYATPEPLGLKMVEWANIKSGEKILEPSAGHGAIARYFPQDTHRTLVEPSSSLASRASLNSTGARVVVDRFENLDPGANKFDAIVMNPPFGHGGKDATEHLLKAVKHLKNGGRIVALIPRGGMADNRFNARMESPSFKDVYLVADINLPPVTFERAGTQIATRVVVLEKQTDPEVAQKLQQQSRDYSNAETVGEMFDRIEHSGIRDRLEPKTKDVDVPAEGGITIGGIEFKLTGESKGVVYADIKSKLGRDVFAKTAKMAEAAGGRYIRTLKSFEFPNAETRAKFLDTVANPPKEAEAPSSPSGVTFKTAETVHGKTGAKVFVAVPDQRVERDIYNQLVTTAKGFGGYYSSFKGGKAIPGFQFTTEENRAKFIAKLGGAGLGEPEAPLGSEPDEYDPDLTASERRERDDLDSRRDDLSNDEMDRRDELERRFLLQDMRQGLAIQKFKDSRGPHQGAAAQTFTLQMGRRTDNEWLAVVGPDGRVVEVNEGDYKSVNFTPEFERMALDPRSDMVVHHNHPSGRSLSAPDVSALGYPGITAIWAHGHNGNVYRIALTPAARAALPADVTAARVKLFKLHETVSLNVEKMMEPAILNGSISVDDANMAHGQFVMEMLRDAGIVDYDTNTDPVGLIPKITNLSTFIERALPYVTEDIFGSKTAPNRNDRRAGTVRHAGDVGASFDRIARLPTVGSAAGADPARRGSDRAQVVDRGVGGDQPRLLDAPPGLEDLDKTFNDLLGKRLLGRLGDLNATEMRVQLQDKFARVNNVEEDKGNTDTRLSTYQAESLYYGRAGQRLESLGDHHVNPIIREMKGRDIPYDMMDKFLYAKHAPERNRVVGELYPDGHDFKRATIDPTIKGASGMSNGEAASFIGRLRADGKLADYEAVARMVYALNYRTLQNLFNYGLIDRDTFEQLIKIYKYYVPLRGWQEGGDEGDLPHAGKGMDTRAKAFKQAFGRKTLAASPLAYSIMQAEQAIVKGEKNKVGNVFLKFALANPDPDLWTINRPEPRKYVSKVTGMATSSPTWDMNDARTFVTRVNGRANLIQFKGADGANLARALKDMGSSNVHSAVRMMAAVTHTMARLATAWNPEFMIPNLVRDVGEAFINLGEQRQKAFVRKFAFHILPAMKGSWMAIAEKTAAPGSSAQAYIDAFHEFDREGGRVRFFGIDDPDAIEKKVEKRLKRLSGGAVNSVKDLGDKAGKALEVMGGGIENATRLAAYMAARDVGMSAPDAAMLARNLTVNFNKKGELGTAISSAYMFSNAGGQGIARMVTALHPKNRRVWMAVGALATAGVMSTSFNIGIGGYDKAGVANYMKIPSWERDKNIIIMGPGETYGKIPLPYGYAPFHVLGAHATTVLMGQEKPAAAAAAVFGSIASAFNPLGEEEALITTLVPTALRPAVHIHYNENWTGRPLYPARDFDKGKPNSQQSFRSDTAASKSISEGLNSATGGDRYHPGAIDIHPGSLDHVFGAITGGVGKFFKNIVDTVVNGWNGQPWEASKTPILRRFVGKLDHARADSDVYYGAREEAKEDANRIRQAKQDIRSGADEQAARAFLNAASGGRQKIIFDRADKQMRRLRAEEDRINNSPQPYEAKKAALDAIRLQMRDVQNQARAESAKLKGRTP